jgi:hypothetical protein
MEQDDTADADEIAIGFEQLEAPRRCSVHGLTHVWPCVQCVASGEMDWDN